MTFSPYSSYKDSGTEWIGVVPQYWSVMSLRHALIDIISGITTEQIDESPETVRVTRIETISKGVVNYDKLAFFSSSKVDTSRKLMKGDVLFSNINSLNMIGNCAHFSGGPDLYVGMNLLALRPQSPGAGKWLYWLTSSDQFRCNVEALAKPAINQASISQNAIASIRIPFPTIDEQQAIFAFLDRETAKIDALVAEQERLLALLTEKRKAVISRAVTQGLDPSVPMKDSGVEWLGKVPAHWNIKAIKRLSTVRRGASPRPIDDPRYFDDDGEYAWARISDVTSSDGQLVTTEQRLSALGSSLSVKLAPGELFVSIAGSVGKPCIAGIKTCIHDGFVYFPSLSISAEFLYWIFQAGQCYAGLGKMGTQLNLNTDTVGSIKVAVPPQDEINEICDYIKRYAAILDALKAQAESIVTLFQERRAALISAAVTGKIDVRGLVLPVEPAKEAA